MREEGREREDAGMELPVPSHRARRGSGCHSGAGSPPLPFPPGSPRTAAAGGHLRPRVGPGRAGGGGPAFRPAAPPAAVGRRGASAGT